MSRIILCGASSVGKTTLAADWCSEHARYCQITEVARDVMKERGISREDLLKSRETPEKELYIKLQEMILEEQNKREAELGDSLFISDRGPDPLVYTYLVDKDRALEMCKSQAAADCFARYRRSLVVLVCPLESSTDDGFRMVQCKEEQEKFTSKLRTLLTKFRIPYLSLGERNRELRVEVLRRAVQGEVTVSMKSFIAFPCLSFYLVRDQRAKNLCGQDTGPSIRTILLNPCGIQLRYGAMEGSLSNRVVASYGEDYLICIKFHDSIPSSMIREILRQGVQVNGDMYHFLGSSPDGLADRRCYMLKGTVENVEDLLSQYGDFSSVRMVSGQVKGVSQLLTVGRDSGVEVCSEKISIIEETKDVLTCEGCGVIGLKLAEEIAIGANAKVTGPEDNIPSVLQVIFLGYKCVVSRQPSVDTNSIFVRKSAEKFGAGTKAFQTFWVCAHSRPNSYGHLSKEYIMLLSGLGVSDETLILRQNDYLVRLDGMLADTESARLMLDWQNNCDIAALCTSPEDLTQDILQLSLKHVRSELILRLESLTIPLIDSRMLFGVCDPLDVLKDDECFIRVSINGAPRTIQSQVIVGKRLCYRLGDIHMLTAVDQEGLNHFVDCIVLKRPHAAVVGGSDPAGEQYFVCWDRDMIPACKAAAQNYSFLDSPPDQDVTREMRIDHFSEQENFNAQISKHFQFWADLNGVSCNECERLGVLFSLSTSSSKKMSIPHEFVSPSGPLKARPDRVWNRMQAIAKDRRLVLTRKIVEEALTSEESTSVRAIGEEFIRDLVDDNRVISEYSLFRLLHKWCSVQDMPESEKVEMLREFCDKIDFCVFTLVERREAVKLGVPVDRVMNALCKSRLITPDMLLPLYLTPPACGWRLHLRTSGGEFHWNSLLSALTNFPESLFIMQLQDENKLALNDVKLALHFNGPLRENKFGTISPGSLSTCIYSPQLNSVLRHVTECEYSLKLTEDVLQVFQNQEICDTFIFIKRRYVDKKNNTEKHNIVSMDLNRFKGGVNRNHVHINKTSFSSAEIFVRIPNRAVEHDPPNSFLPPEALEDAPSDEEEGKEDELLVETDPIRVLAPDAALKDLKEFAKNGDCLDFSRIISSENNEVLELIPQRKMLDQVLALLWNLVVKTSHRKPSEEIGEYLINVLQSPLIKFQTPKDFLFLYSCLEKLHMTEIILQHISRGLNSITLETVSQYFECVINWEWWTFIPFSVSCQLLDKLYQKYSLLISNMSEQCDDEPIRDKIMELARSGEKPPPPIDARHSDVYMCYFTHLMLTHLLAESPNPGEYEKLVDTESSVSMLRAMQSQESLLSPEIVASEIKEEGESTKQENPELFQLTFYRTNNFSSDCFVAGSYVKIRLLPTSGSEHSQKPIALGRITNVSSNLGGNHITVNIHEPVPDCIKRSAQSNTGHWGVTIVGDVSRFKRAVRSLQRLQGSPHISPILVSPDAFPPDVHTEELTMEFSTKLLDEVIEQRSQMIIKDSMIKKESTSACKNRFHFNLSQEDAITTALNQRLTLIHGYPGAGKTVVASEIILRYLSEQNGDDKFKILATAATDRAVDILTRALLTLNLFVVRVGDLKLISPDVHEHTLDQQVETKRTQLNCDTEAFQYNSLKQEILNSADIIATKCFDAGNKDLRDIKFSFIVIDDATLVMEPLSLIPIVKSCQKLVLVGDLELFPPALPSSGCSIESSSKGISPLNSLRITLFHRLYKSARPLLLEEQHRMHPHIAQFPTRVFYSGRMSNGVTVDEKTRPPPHFKFIFTNKPVVFIHVESKEIDSAVSIANPTEADGVVEIVKTLMASGIVSLKDIAVLTPYPGQVECVNERLEYAAIKVDVSTIDDFQGRERNIIVFSTVRSNIQAELGLAGDPYRINTLLTRAQLVLIGIGNGDTLCSSEIWDEWLKRYDVINEDKFFQLIEEPVKNEKSHRSKSQHSNYSNHDDESVYSYSSGRESEIGSEMSWYSDSGPENCPPDRNQTPVCTQGRKYPRLSEMTNSSNVDVTDSSNETYEWDQ